MENPIADMENNTPILQQSTLISRQSIPFPMSFAIPNTGYPPEISKILSQTNPVADNASISDPATVTIHPQDTQYD